MSCRAVVELDVTLLVYPYHLPTVDACACLPSGPHLLGGPPEEELYGGAANMLACVSPVTTGLKE